MLCLLYTFIFNNTRYFNVCATVAYLFVQQDKGYGNVDNMLLDALANFYGRLHHCFRDN